MPRVGQRQAQLMQEVMVGRVRWLIRLRWLAAAGLVATAFAARELTGVQVEPVPVILIAIAIAAYNGLLQWWLARSGSPAAAVASATMQIIADFWCLAALINCTGGLINPLIVFMMFHAAIAGIILSRLRAYLLAGFGTFLIVLMGLAHMSERFSTWRIPLGNFPLETTVAFGGHDIALARHPVLVLAIAFATGSGMFLSAYFTSSIARQLRQAYRQLAAAHQRASEREEAKSLFMRTMAHQLRSPLAAITSLINAVAQTKMVQADRLADIHRRIKARCASMMDLVDDLLRLAQVREGSVREDAAEPINASVRFKEIAASFEATAADRQVTLEHELPSHPVMVLAGPRDLGDLLGNLIGNAVKYTPSGGTVRLSSRLQGGTLVTEVTDTGIGIPQADMQRLFTEFFRAANAKKQEAHSSGLGLSICKEIVDRLGGRIECRSKEGEGTTFRFELRVAGATGPLDDGPAEKKDAGPAAASKPAVEGM